MRLCAELAPLPSRPSSKGTEMAGPRCCHTARTLLPSSKRLFENPNLSSLSLPGSGEVMRDPKDETPALCPVSWEPTGELAWKLIKALGDGAYWVEGLSHTHTSPGYHSSLAWEKPGVVPHACNPSTGRWRQEDQRF